MTRVRSTQKGQGTGRKFLSIEGGQVFDRWKWLCVLADVTLSDRHDVGDELLTFGNGEKARADVGGKAKKISLGDKIKLIELAGGHILFL